jgi:hypothetical protein
MSIVSPVTVVNGGKYRKCPVIACEAVVGSRAGGVSGGSGGMAGEGRDLQGIL